MTAILRTRAIRYGLAGALAALAVAGSGATANAATARESASRGPVAVSEGCGYLGWGKYRHCDGGTGSTVMLDVEDFWGALFRYCVGPGTTNLQPVIKWRVTGAWWNGGTRCIPGYYGPA
ncbi:DUF6355 family natural product biosynthesis protein [Amycolatopsis roodepoortensis]|uniref:DUF6355 family natural product biosynthesis protein n=1 Tax=Amycolatopsis roodepoortensis TaxID=700274 RepID=UPI00214AFF64|nr:DUF6355 family natural product biosynthesis protein [Amycolatopsis roodepoortensis]UUV28559.1 DUF6355 family natural product biosynthesis protein [Amycolatopsis roodepoortensis]